MTTMCLYFLSATKYLQNIFNGNLQNAASMSNLCCTSCTGLTNKTSTENNCLLIEVVYRVVILQSQYDFSRAENFQYHALQEPNKI